MIPNNSTSKIVQDKFAQLLAIKEKYETLNARKAIAQEGIKNYLSVDSVSLISTDLFNREICIGDGAFISEKKKG
jgi:hypothetical protein